MYLRLTGAVLALFVTSCSALFLPESPENVRRPEDTTDRNVLVCKRMFGEAVGLFRRAEWSQAENGFEELRMKCMNVSDPVVSGLRGDATFYLGATLNRLGKYEEARDILSDWLDSSTGKTVYHFASEIPLSVGEVPPALIALELGISLLGLGEESFAKNTVKPFRLGMVAALTGGTDVVQLVNYEKFLGDCVLTIPVPHPEAVRPEFLLAANHAGQFVPGMSVDSARQALPIGWAMNVTTTGCCFDPEGMVNPAYEVRDDTNKRQLMLGLDGPEIVHEVVVLGSAFVTDMGLSPGMPLSEVFKKVAPESCEGNVDRGFYVSVAGESWAVFCRDHDPLYPDVLDDPCVCHDMMQAGCKLYRRRFFDSTQRQTRRLSGEDVAGMSALCAQLPQCKREGQCTYGESGCHVSSQADCRQSLACKKDRRCANISGECQRPSACTTFRGCRQNGQCRWLDGACRPGSDKDCRKTAACPEEGKCSYRRGSGCVLAGNADCAKTTACHEEGRCSYRKGIGCTLARTSDCRLSRGCKEDARCTFSPDEGCVIGSSSDCRRSTQCREFDYCYEKDGRCVEEWDILSRKKRIKRCMKSCRQHMTKLSKLKSRYVRAARKGDDEARWKLDEELEHLESEFQTTADRLSDIMEEMQSEGASETTIRRFVNDTRTNCSL